MSAIEIMIFVLLWVLTLESFIAVLLILQRAAIRRAIRHQEVRDHFAVSRGELMRLALEGKIESKTETFIFFYSLSTLTLRNNESYPELGDIFMKILFSRDADPETSPLANEAREWNNETKELAKRLSEGIDLVVMNCSRTMRALVWLQKNFAILTITQTMLSKFLYILERRDERVRQLESIKNDVLLPPTKA